MSEKDTLKPSGAPPTDADEVEKPFTCAECDAVFDLDEKMPVLLAVCGHSVCKECFAANTAKKGTMKCSLCQKPSKIPEANGRFTKNINLCNLLEQGNPSSFGRCADHPNGELEHYCFDKKCVDKAPFCSFCLLNRHPGCQEALIMPLKAVKEAVTGFNVPDVENWLQRNKNSIEKGLEEVKERLMGLLDNFALIFKNRLSSVVKFDLNNIGVRPDQLELRTDGRGEPQVVCQEVEFVSQVARDFDDMFHKGRFFREWQKEENMMVVRAARKLFNDPTGTTTDARLAARIKKVNPFIQKHFFLTDLSLDKLGDEKEFWQRVSRQFDTRQTPKVATLFTGSKWEDEWTRFVEGQLRTELPPIAVSLPQIEYRLQEKLTEYRSDAGRTWTVCVFPNELLDDDAEVAARSARFRVNDLLVTVAQT